MPEYRSQRGADSHPKQQHHRQSKRCGCGGAKQNDAQSVLQTPLWQPFLASLLPGFNTWSKPDDQWAFHIDTNWFTFQQWQSLVYTDATSVFKQ
jgi:hypothetical protein